MLVLVFSVFAGGCTSESESELPVQTISQTPMSEISIISYEKTPVSYLDLSYNVSLAYREFGKPDSEPLLMIIGFGGTMDSWNTTFISLLSENYHVYIYDHRDMGESSKTLSNFTIYDLSDDAANLITGLGYDSMNTYSVSMGSTVAQQLLISHPEKVRKAVLSSATYSVLIPKTEVLHGLIEDALTNPDSSEGVVKEAVANLGYPGCYDNLSSIKNDIMLITGTEDIITPQSVAVLIADRINGSWLVRFKGIPHMGSSYAPYEYAEITKIFLEMNETPT
ncbi:alpha/beta hydrolase [Methanomicrobium antiquum]|uniref:Alpha/beta hydrolase n=1 Tax=Methanomicrobium antiquum TaxID=487686 RepID=A0AAF0FKS2_9EURY|nr:alpha/beta fold hydrolase [Methanomicrobium antiquum]WFN36318.1 alpha/beta hydrolase [Methanomicrobium antiquum]